ncbi:MAG: transposase [Acidobacteriota bacterium]
MPRAVLPGVAHHVTQRGVNRQTVFLCRSDYEVYLELMRASAHRCAAALLGYCLMPNHVHWVVSPPEADSLTRVFGEAHSRYAHYANAKLNRSGHFWQNRFFSCALDGAHHWAALRYVERNPVRSGLVAAAWAWEWSSAAVHAGREQSPDWLAMREWRETFSSEEWRVYLTSDTLTEADLALRANTYSGRPIGPEAFVEAAEAALGRRLRASKGGRPPGRQSAAAAGGEPAQAWLFAEG